MPNLGRISEAREYLKSALTISEENYKHNPSNPQDVENLVIILGYIASNAGGLGDPVGERRARQQALENIEEFCRRTSNSEPEVAIVRAVAQSEMGKMLAREGERIKSLSLHRQALQTREEIMRSALSGADRRRHSRGLSIALADSAISYLLLGDHGNALQQLDRSLEIERGLLAVDPGHIETRWMIASRLRTRGEILLKQHRRAEALQNLQAALNSLEAERVADPANYRCHQGVIYCLKSLAKAYVETGRFNQARTTEALLSARIGEAEKLNL